MLIIHFKPPKPCNRTTLQPTGKAFKKKNCRSYNIHRGFPRGESIFIPRIPLIPLDYPFEFERLQFPFKLQYVITINKFQEQTLNLQELSDFFLMVNFMCF